jgi:hypothetical protein
MQSDAEYSLTLMQKRGMYALMFSILNPAVESILNYVDLAQEISRTPLPQRSSIFTFLLLNSITDHIT